MSDQTKLKPLKPSPSVEHIQEFHAGDLNDLCDATDDAIEGGGGFGWVKLPNRDVLERYWNGVLAMPARELFIAPWARGHGLAKMLIEEAEKFAREDGFAVINLDVRETLVEAMALYESVGYQRIGEHPAYAHVDGKTLKGYYYCKVIDKTIA